MSKPVIAFVTGGYSAEASVSYKSAETIRRHIDTDLFSFHEIDIRPDGWWLVQDGKDQAPVERADFTVVLNGEKISFDAVLMGIHGTPGEDGRLQGYFDLLNMPYTCCDATTSAITFNKRYAVAVAGANGIRVARGIHYTKGDLVNYEQLGNRLGFPVFVKPASGGSSIGMSKVADLGGLAPAFEKAFAEDNEVLVEEMVEGREFTVGVYRHKGEIVTLPITEVISENYFFDFEAKYHGKSREITPAAIDSIWKQRLQQAAVQVYKVFHCRGVVRIDFIYNESVGEPFMLEVNTVPGQSAASIVPQQVQCAGMNLMDFYTQLIEECLPART
jgi:D-alanine-D-alanine ligase